LRPNCIRWSWRRRGAKRSFCLSVSVALDDRSVPLGQRRGQLRLQRIDVGRGLIRGGAHT
jgi:hypothetical protein